MLQFPALHNHVRCGCGQVVSAHFESNLPSMQCQHDVPQLSTSRTGPPRPCLCLGVHGELLDRVVTRMQMCWYTHTCIRPCVFRLIDCDDITSSQRLQASATTSTVSLVMHSLKQCHIARLIPPQLTGLLSLAQTRHKISSHARHNRVRDRCGAFSTREHARGRRHWPMQHGEQQSMHWPRRGLTTSTSQAECAKPSKRVQASRCWCSSSVN
jgi:hypothetical protein